MMFWKRWPPFLAYTEKSKADCRSFKGRAHFFQPVDYPTSLEITSKISCCGGGYCRKALGRVAPIVVTQKGLQVLP